MALRITRPKSPWGCLVATLVMAAVLFAVPWHSYDLVSGPPEIFSNEDSGIILLPEWIFTDSKPAASILWCSLQGWFARASCLPSLEVTGLHVWFLRPSGVEYHAVEPFPIQSAAYISEGNLRWYRGRDTWEWAGQDFRKLGEAEAPGAVQPVRDEANIEDATRASGWRRHRVDGEGQAFSLGQYRVRYTRSAFDDRPTELVIETGPTVGTLYSRIERSYFTGLVNRLPEFPVREH